MNEFLKLDWGINDASELEPQDCFIKDEYLTNSLVYKHLDEPLRNPSNANNINFKQKGPMVPGDRFFRKELKKSLLNKWQQEYCLEALKLIQSGKDPSKFTQNELFCLKIYNDLQPKITEEMDNYLKFVESRWDHDKERKDNLWLMAGVYWHAKETWDIQCKRVLEYPRFYKIFTTFNMCYNNTYSIEFNCMHNALEVGTLARFSYPNLKTSCILKCVTLPNVEQNPRIHSKLPVSKDENILGLLEKYNIDLVISSGGLKRLTDHGDFKINWNMPVVVKDVTVKLGNGPEIKKKVVYVDKPFPKTTVDPLDLGQISVKKLLRTNFCQYEGFQFPTEDKPVDKTAENPEDSQVKEDIITDEDKNKPCSSKSYKQFKRSQNTLHHNVSYKIWKIKKRDEQCNLMKNKSKNVEMSILVRSKLAGCEVSEQGPLTPVVLQPKLERQLSFGANIPSKSELVRDWTSLFFTPFSTLYRARVQPRTCEVISVERCPVQKIICEAQAYYEFSPQLSLGMLQIIFSELLKLAPGNYLLQHLAKQESFVSILKQSEEQTSDAYDLHAEYENCSESKILKPWLPLDINYILPAFEANNRMPCMFAAYERRAQKNTLTKNKKIKIGGIKAKMKNKLLKKKVKRRMIKPKKVKKSTECNAV